MVFSLRQLQEKCREQWQPLFVAFIDLTKAFDLVSRDGLLKILLKIGCSPQFLNIISSFHEEMKSTVVFDGWTSDPFDIQSRVKQGYVLTPNIFGIFFAVMLKHAFGTATEGVYLQTRSYGSSLISLDWEQRPKSNWNPCRTSPMMQSSLPTLLKTSNNSWII